MRKCDMDLIVVGTEAAKRLNDHQTHGGRGMRMSPHVCVCDCVQGEGAREGTKLEVVPLGPEINDRAGSEWTAVEISGRPTGHRRPSASAARGVRGCIRGSPECVNGFR
ncbi:hypothetical protein ZHAS_00002216 [Anopheles sinensis]|uniref:Uncharacterized protein n=1 Tax=Anopheles sinensis TaxID=74873 RepID=A0A084VBW9_ANOSI|nr:hypothetical protein ZHAS_00002216 [Anopheles sinensis]